jgi:hypothetical protein
MVIIKSIRANALLLLALIAGANSLLLGCGGGGSQSSALTYFSQGGLFWSGTLPSSLPGNLYYTDGVANSFTETPNYQCTGQQGVNGGPVLPNNFNKEAGWRMPTIGELKSLYLENPKPSNWSLGLVWARGTDSYMRLDFNTGAIVSGNGGTGLAVCVKPSS